MAHTDTVPLCEAARPIRRGRYIVPADKTTALAPTTVPERPFCFRWPRRFSAAACRIRRCASSGPSKRRSVCTAPGNARLGLLGRPQLAFNFDGGSAEKITIGATGGYRMDIHIRGRASHAGVVPEQGINAITIASLAIAQLHREGWLGRIKKSGREGTSNVGVIHGGNATNVVTPEVDLRAEARSHDPVFRGQIIRAIERAFEKAARSVRNVEGDRGEVTIDGHLDYEAFRLADDEPCILAAEEAVRRCDGKPERAISNGGLDANWMSARGIPTVTFGCGQENVHTTSERLDLAEFRRACSSCALFGDGGLIA